jgi:hypothetical protein
MLSGFLFLRNMASVNTENVMYVAWNKKYHLRSGRSNMYEDRYQPDANVLEPLPQNTYGNLD